MGGKEHHTHFGSAASSKAAHVHKEVKVNSKRSYPLPGFDKGTPSAMTENASCVVDGVH